MLKLNFPDGATLLDPNETIGLIPDHIETLATNLIIQFILYK